jgi:hypothetical protein
LADIHVIILLTYITRLHYVHRLYAITGSDPTIFYLFYTYFNNNKKSVIYVLANHLFVFHVMMTAYSQTCSEEETNKFSIKTVCGFRRNRSTTDQIFCIHQILEKKWEYNETVHQLFVYFKKAYDLQLLKIFPAYYGTLRFITVFTRDFHWFLSWARSTQYIPSHPI